MRSRMYTVCKGVCSGVFCSQSSSVENVEDSGAHGASDDYSYMKGHLDSWSQQSGAELT